MATDGRILSILSIADLIEDCDKESFLVPVDALKVAYEMYNRTAQSSKRNVFIRASVGEIAVTQYGTRTAHIYDKPRGQYPKWESVVNPPKAFSTQISLSASLLKRLADSMIGEDDFYGVTISVTDSDRRLYITKGKNGGDSLGIIMPMNVEPILPCKFWETATETKDEQGRKQR